jgi:alpha-L-rhamnosidase
MGDWFPAKTETPVEVTSTAYTGESARLLSRIASLLGRADDAAAYARLAGRVREAFRRRFVDPASGRVGGGTQAAHACALAQGLLEGPEADAAARLLAEDVERLDGHLDCGILGARHILPALTDHGRVDLAYRLAAQTTWPSWGDMVRQGATTLWEGWNVDIGTHNHVMLGGISAWFFQALAGIGCDEDGPGFKKIVIRPRLAGDLAWVKAHHDSPYGRIVSRWSRDGDRLTLEVAIPPNTTATVHVPAADAAGVTESARPAAESGGVRFLRQEDGAAVYAVAPGRYRFESRTPGPGAVLARCPGAVPAPA